MTEDKPLDKPLKDWISFRAPAELARQLRIEAKDRGATMTAVIVERLMGGVDNSGSQDPAMRTPDPESPLTGMTTLQDGNWTTEVPCKHPKDRQRPVLNGKLCLDCKRVLT